MRRREGYCGIGGVFKDEWWSDEVKREGMGWDEGLVIGVGEVNKEGCGYGSKDGIGDVGGGGEGNVEFVKWCEVEKRERGEGMEVMSKVMGSICNGEIGGMEVMKRMGGIEG